MFVVVVLNDCFSEPLCQNTSSALLSRSRVSREMEYDFLAGVSDLLALLEYFLLYLGGSCK